MTFLDNWQNQQKSSLSVQLSKGCAVGITISQSAAFKDISVYSLSAQANRAETNVEPSNSGLAQEVFSSRLNTLASDDLSELETISGIWVQEEGGLIRLVGMLLPAASATQSLSRYVLVLVPVFMMLGYWGKRPMLDRSMLVGFSIFLGLFTTLFVNWIFIA